MTRTFELEISPRDTGEGGGIAQVFTLPDRPVVVGRSPSSDLVVANEHVSWHHALIWAESDAVWLRDLQSRNGCLVDGARVDRPVRLVDGAQVQLGPQVVLTVRGGPPQASRAHALALEDRTTGARFTLHSDRFRVGPDDDADLRVEGVSSVVLIVHPDGEVWLGQDEQDYPIDVGEEFCLGERCFRLTQVDLTRAPTAAAEGARYPYEIDATLQGATGPEARLHDPGTGQTHTVSADNRAILLYLLARKIVRDADLPADQRGWCDDTEVATGVWGRSASAADSNKLHVLVYRLRRELKDAGFDPWFIEKRRRYIRVRVRSARVD